MNTPEQPQTQLAAFLADCDVPCPSCHYNLRGLRDATCPECQQALRLHVGLVEPKLGSFLAAFIPLCMGLGLSALLILFWFIVSVFRNSGATGNGRFLTVLVAGLLIFTVAVVVLLKNRSRFTRAPDLTRGMVSGGCMLLTLVYVVVFALTVK